MDVRRTQSAVVVGFENDRSEAISQDTKHACSASWKGEKIDPTYKKEPNPVNILILAQGDSNQTSPLQK